MKIRPARFEPVATCTQARLGLAWAGVCRRGAERERRGHPAAGGPAVFYGGSLAKRFADFFVRHRDRLGDSLDEVAAAAVGRALAERVPVVVMVYANLVMARGFDRFFGLSASLDMPITSEPAGAWRSLRAAPARQCLALAPEPLDVRDLLFADAGKLVAVRLRPKSAAYPMASDRSPIRWRRPRRTSIAGRACLRNFFAFIARFAQNTAAFK